MTATNNRGYSLPTINGDYGTWGGELNVGVITVIDANLGGSVFTSMGPGGTVSLSNSVVQNLMQTLSGTASALVLFPTPGMWTANNISTVSVTIGVGTSIALGGTVVVPPGSTMVVNSDGTNAYSATSAYVQTGGNVNFNSMTIAANETVTGTLSAGSVSATGRISGASASISGTSNIGGNETVGGTLNAGVVASAGAITGASASLSGTVTAQALAMGAPIPVNQGGIGAASLAANALLLGAGTSPITGLAPGAAGNVLVSNGTIWQSGTVASISKFTSGDQTVPANGAMLSVAHGLGSAPFQYQWYLKNVTGEAGWSAGDTVKLVEFSQYVPGVTSAYGCNVWADSTNINVGLALNGLVVQNKNTGSTVPITTANWKLIVKAWI